MKRFEMPETNPLTIKAKIGTNQQEYEAAEKLRQEQAAKQRALDEQKKQDEELAKNSASTRDMTNKFIANAKAFIDKFAQEQLAAQITHVHNHAATLRKYAASKKKPSFYTQADADAFIVLAEKIKTTQGKIKTWESQFEALKSHAMAIRNVLNKKTNTLLDKTESSNLVADLNTIIDTLEHTRTTLHDSKCELISALDPIDHVGKTAADTVYARFAKNTIEINNRTDDTLLEIVSSTGAKFQQDKYSTTLASTEIDNKSPEDRLTCYFEMLYSEFIRYGTQKEIPITVYCHEALCALLVSAKALGIPAQNIKLSYLANNADAETYNVIPKNDIQAWYSAISTHSKEPSEDISAYFKDSSGTSKYATLTDLYKAAKALNKSYQVQLGSAGEQHGNLRDMVAGLKDERKKHEPKTEQAISIASDQLFFKNTDNQDKHIADLNAEGKEIASELQKLAK